MYRFQREQRSFEIGNATFGGQPGGKSVMVGSVFHPRHSLLTDPRSGEVDGDALQQKIEAAERSAAALEQPHALMACIEHAGAAHALLGQLADRSEAAIFIDSPSMGPKLAAMAAAEEMGISSRMVYNGLHIESPDEEWQALEEHGADTAVLLAFDPGEMSVKGRIYMLDNGGRITRRGLIDKAEAHGVKRPLIDMAATSYQQNAGASLRALTVAKAKWGLPCGLALRNTVETWPPFADMDEGERKTFLHVDSSTVALSMAAGADWFMYGPIESAERMLHTAAFTAGVMSQAVDDIR